MLADGVEGVLGGRGRGHGPLQQPGQQGPHQALGEGAQVHVAGHVGQRHHHILTDNLHNDEDEVKGPNRIGIYRQCFG